MNIRAGAVIALASANYPKIQNKYQYRNSAKAGQDIGAVFVWILTHLWLIFLLLAVVGIIIRIVRRYRARKREEQRDLENFMRRIKENEQREKNRKFYEEQKRAAAEQQRRMEEQARRLKAARQKAEPPNTKAELEAYKHHQFVVQQRRLMTDSLRYDVLRRDGFRCQLCGATAADGWKLHVDHIVPVSNGGLTEMSNLRTLCERCNLGKGAKTE